MKKFSCVQGCSDCCIYREYYPSVEYGKIGVLLLPEEKVAIEQLAKIMNIKVRIVPRLAIGRDSPEKIIAYQMMGNNNDGNLCPFLEVESNERSPHGGFKCKIYSRRPLACRAYPVIDTVDRAAKLDSHCQFCKKFSTTKATSAGLQQEIEALAIIRAGVITGIIIIIIIIIKFLSGAMRLPPVDRMGCFQKAGLLKASSRVCGTVPAHVF